jgi:hypothetical protein
MDAVKRSDLSILTDRAEEKIIAVVGRNPGLYSPASLVQAMERGELGGVGRVVIYWGADERPHSDATGAVALWSVLGSGKIYLGNDWKLYPPKAA